jgi:putative peptidoglycan lipid II flippase
MTIRGGNESVAGAAGARAPDAIVDRHRGLVGRTVLVSGLTLLSRILGFVREVLSAALFGDTSAIWDAFVTAWRVPNLFRRFFGEGAISTSLQAALTEADGDGGNEVGRRLFLRTARTMVVVLLGVSALAMLAAYAVPDAFLGSDPAPVRELVVRLLPFVVLICLAALAAGALHVRGHYTAPNVAPSLMNLVWIATLCWIGVEFVWGDRAPPSEAGALKGYQLEMARWLAWGALASGAVQILAQLPALSRTGLLRPPAELEPARIAEAELRRRSRAVLWSSIPLALGAAVYQINVMVDGFMAEAFLADGGPSAHYLANRVQQFPLALIALAATSAIFPALKALGHRNRVDELRALHDKAQLGVCFLALPASVGLFVLAQPMASVLFEHGAYGREGVLRVAGALRMLALALLPAGAVGLASRTYYARGDFRTPVRISIVALLANAGLNVLFVVRFGMDVEGLALATALSSWAQLAILLPGLTRVLRLPDSRAGAAGRVARMVAAAAVSGAAAWGAFRVLGADGGGGRAALGLVAAGGAGVASYLAAAHLLRLRELGDVLSRLRARGGNSAGPGG